MAHKFVRETHRLRKVDHTPAGVDDESLQALEAEERSTVFAFTRANPYDAYRPVPAIPDKKFGPEGTAVCDSIYMQMDVPRGLRRVFSLVDPEAYWGGKPRNETPELAINLPSNGNTGIRAITIAGQIDNVSPYTGQDIDTTGYEKTGSVEELVSPRVDYAVRCSPGRPCKEVLMADESRKSYLSFEWDWQLYESPMRAWAEQQDLSLPDRPVHLVPALVTGVEGGARDVIWMVFVDEGSRKDAHCKIRSLPNDFNFENWEEIRKPVDGVGILLLHVDRLSGC